MNDKSLRTELKKKISGQVFWQKEILDYYSVDASFYQIKPLLVVIPKKRTDVVMTIKIARKNHIPVTVRGAGTGLVGSALGSGIILDLKNFNAIKISKNFVTVEPGVLKGNLDLILKKKKKFLPPNPSIGPYCSLGGMIGTNASGSRTLKYGSIIDNLIEVTIVSSTGKIITLPNEEKIANEIFNLAKKIDKKKFPNVSKNSSGYRLDLIKKHSDSHKIIAGSEGTLGIVISAKLRILDLPKKRHLFVIGYDSLKNISKDCQRIIKTNPSALEFVDRSTLNNINFKFSSKTQCLLLIEHDSELKRNPKKVQKIVHGKIFYETRTESDIDKWWKYRDSALSFSLKSISKGEKAPHIIEDAAIQLEKITKIFLIINHINKKFGTRTIVYGHAGNGNLHIRLVIKNKKNLEKIAKYFFLYIIKQGGTISGEHGDGYARSKFVKTQYGIENYYLFVKLKKMFDPDGILNPDKIITHKKSITEYLR